MTTAYEAYARYVGFKNHFNVKHYDLFKYEGALTISKDALQRRSDKRYFNKLARHRDIDGYLLANMIRLDDYWVGDIEKGEESYQDWRRRVDSLTYIFTQDIRTIGDIKRAVKIVPDQMPEILQLFFNGKICMETLTILVDLLGLHAPYTRALENDALWRAIELKLIRYRPFLNINTEKFKDIIRKEASIEKA